MHRSGPTAEEISRSPLPPPIVPRRVSKPPPPIPQNYEEDDENFVGKPKYSNSNPNSDTK